MEWVGGIERKWERCGNDGGNENVFELSERSEFPFIFLVKKKTFRRTVHVNYDSQFEQSFLLYDWILQIIRRVSTNGRTGNSEI